MIATKAETLEWLAPRVTRGTVLPLAHFRVAEWRADRRAVLSSLAALPFAGQPLIVRSSAVGEDAADASQAGRFVSVADVAGATDLAQAIERVIDSYGDGRGDHRVLVQPMLSGTMASGVAFTRDPASGAPYVVVNYREGADTAAVTGGRADDLKTFYAWKGAPVVQDGLMADVLALAAELEDILGLDALDFEFGSTGAGLPVLFQVRPLVMKARPEVSAEAQDRVLGLIATKLESALKPRPYLHGKRTVFGVMPDWNPAEIIGVRPRPLALSLYRDLVTDAVWAYQRHNYGYKNLRSFPLLTDFHGLPYIDVRVSFNSFVPADLEGGLADRLVNHYIDRLVAAPSLHDKIEFEIVLSCYSFDLRERLAHLPSDLFTDADRGTLAASLRRLTNRIIDNGDDGLWRMDAARIEELQMRRAAMMAADVDKVSRIYWLLEDCKRYGTLPFAGLARAGFIATQMLRSLVTVGVLTADELNRFMTGLDSISAAIGRDLRDLSRTDFLARYGHLRPGTYDILSPRYDEAPDRYFDWTGPVHDAPAKPRPFSLSLKQMRAIEMLLEEHGLEHRVVGLFDFLEAGIRNREHAKFVFTRSLSDALSLFASLGAEHGLSVDDMSFADVGCIGRLYAGSEDPAEVLADSIARGRERHRMTRQLSLPPLITSPEQVWRFHQPATEPNFVTQGETVGLVCTADSSASLAGGIVLLPNADPGFDWIFSRNIAGFVTAYGGVNSHMAVRASELSLPAVIGAGETLYAEWSQARLLRLDCLNRQVQVLG